MFYPILNFFHIYYIIFLTIWQEKFITNLKNNQKRLQNMKNYAKILSLTSKIEHGEFTIPHNHQIILNKLKVNKSSFKILILNKLCDVKNLSKLNF